MRTYHSQAYHRPRATPKFLKIVGLTAILVILILGGWLFFKEFGFRLGLPPQVEVKAASALIDLDTARQFLALRSRLGRAGFTVIKLEKNKEVGIVVELKEGPKLYFNPLKSLDNQLDTLQTVLRKDEKLQEEFRDLKYIDLRIPGRIYYQ